MTAISTKEIAIATVDASSHRDVLTARELLSSQLKSRGPQLIVTPQAHFLMLRCLNGWNVACIRSKDITAMPVTEVGEKQMLIMVSTNKIGSNLYSRSAIKMKNKFPASQPQRRKKILQRKWHFLSSNKHISHGQVYIQVQGTSAKITVLYKKNNRQEVHCDHSNIYSKEYSIPCAALG